MTHLRLVFSPALDCFQLRRPALVLCALRCGLHRFKMFKLFLALFSTLDSFCFSFKNIKSHLCPSWFPGSQLLSEEKTDLDSSIKLIMFSFFWVVNHCCKPQSRFHLMCSVTLSLHVWTRRCCLILSARVLPSRCGRSLCSRMMR